MSPLESIYQIWVRILEFFIPGILGGLVAHYLSLRLFRTQQRINTQREFQLKRLDALRDISLYLHWVYRDVFYNWEKPANDKQNPEEYIFELMNKVNYWKTLFLNDQEISNSLQKLSSLIGTDRDSFTPGKNSLSTTIEEIRKPITNKIIEIERTLS